MIEKILERLEEIKGRYTNMYTIANQVECPNMGMLYAERIEMCEDAIRIVQEVAKEYSWIPVSERLPEPFQRVLVYDAWDDSMTIEHLQENDSFIDSVVAWMPLPIAPYQKGE